MPEHAIPATYRRAPRTERFIATGVGIGAIVGLVIGLLLPAGSGVGRGTAGLLVAIAGALAGGLISGAQAAFMEYTSGQSADRQRHDIETDWAPVAGTTPAPDLDSAPGLALGEVDENATASQGDEGMVDGSR